MQKKRINSSLITGALALCFLSVSVLGARNFFSNYMYNGALSDTNTYRFEFPVLAAADPVEPDSYQRIAAGRTSVPDLALELYRSDAAKNDVLFFYTKITGSSNIARVILDNAEKNNIPAALAFSLAWEESRYQPRAVNKNATSIDRGLFQLNSRAFPSLTEKDFFTPNTSAYYGLAHLNVCMEQAGNEIAALAMYNAGPTKVRNNNTPQRTLDYIARITSYRDRIENLFRSEVAVRYHIESNGAVIPVLAPLAASAN